MTVGSRPLRVMIADDEAPARNRLKDLLNDCVAHGPLALVAEVASGPALLEALQEMEADLVFLDIRMPGMDGLETARHLQKLANPPRVVFTTAYDRYAVEAFDLHAIDYLLKPVRGRRLEESLARVRAAMPAAEVLEHLAREPRTHFSIQERGRVHLVPVKDVLYLRAELKYVTVRTADREFLMEESLTRLEEEFHRAFVRIHRGCLVAIAHLKGFEKSGDASPEAHWLAVIEGLGERLPVSRRQAHVVREFGKSGA